MKRVICKSREDWQKKIKEVGLVFDAIDGKPYWDESAHYRFTMREVDMLERVSNELHEMCLNAVQYVVDNSLFGKIGIPDHVAAVIRQVWEKEPPSIYGRFDLAYDGVNPPKMLEYNADTPTSLLEAAVVQWYWLQEKFPNADQFNLIHERLIAKWKELRDYITGETLYFASMDSVEDAITMTYLQDTAEQTGFKTKPILISDIGWDSVNDEFVDLENERIQSIFKLYPWEWMIYEKFGAHLLKTYDAMQWIEPIWKMILSNKGILAILWEMYPDHPNLLETHFNDPGKMVEYVKKPLFSREGANVTIKTDSGIMSTDGAYGEEGYVCQALAPIPRIDNNYPILGSWVIDGESAGIGIRESINMITDNSSRFIPHLIE